MLAGAAVRDVDSANMRSPPAPALPMKPKVIVMFATKPLSKLPAPPLASIADVAIFINVSEVTVRRWIKRGALPATKIGGQHRIKWHDVDTLIAHNSVVPTPCQAKR